MTKYKCSVCGKELNYNGDKCKECSEKEIKKILAQNPDLKQAFKEAFEETFSPENLEKMANCICRFANGLNRLRDHKDKAD